MEVEDLVAADIWEAGDIWEGAGIWEVEDLEAADTLGAEDGRTAEECIMGVGSILVEESVIIEAVESAAIAGTDSVTTGGRAVSIVATVTAWDLDLEDMD
ncbi:hypothetical protein SAMN05216411_11430 [Nitrosospira multiformis]|nr:hypothetical protein SAMN05216411_11430 [Nitrosospira multiformis]